MKTNLLRTVVLVSCLLMGMTISNAQTIGAGSFHSLALCTTDSVVRSWGANSNGQLGINDTLGRDFAVGVHGSGNNGYLGGVVSIIARENFSLALKGNGTVWAWGLGADGEMGNNTKADQWTPVQVHGPGNAGFLTNVVAISGGYAHALVLKSDSTVWAWGDNTNGELGDNTTTDDSTPVQVHGPGNTGFLTGIIAIAAGQQFSVALKADGTVWAWGFNAPASLGDNTTIQRNTPVQVHGPGNVGFLTNITAIAAGGGHALAIKNDSTVWSWGLNINGELGNIPGFLDSLPAQVHGPGNVGFLTGITYIKTGDYYSAAISKDSTVWTWGYNYYGQLGVNDTTQRNAPVEVHGPGNVGFLKGITSISLGDEHTLALKNDGTLWAWGWNGNGQLGNDSTVDKWTPININNPCNAALGTPSIIPAGNGIAVYPNPANREIKVVNDNHTISALEIYNMLGEKVYQSEVSRAEGLITVDVSAEAGGVYMLRAITAGGVVNQKFIIQK